MKSSNCISLMITKSIGLHKSLEALCQKKLLLSKSVLKKFNVWFNNDKVETSKMLSNLISIKYKGVHH